MQKLKQKWSSIPLAVKISVSYAVCSIFQQCISFITLPLFTRLLTTEQYGQYTIYNSWMGILSIFLTLNLAYGSFSTAMVKYEDDRDGYISSVEGICLLLSGLFLLIYLPFRNLWNRLFELPTALMLVMVAELICATATHLWSGKNRFLFKYKNVITVTLGLSICSPLIGYLLVIHSEQKGYARILAYAGMQILIGGFFFLKEALTGRKLYNKEYWKYALGFNVPLLAYYLSQSIFNQSDRIMISHMVGTDKAAIYGVAYSFGTILTFVLNAINNSYVPWYYGKIKEGAQEENKSVSLGIALLMMILLSSVIWFAPEIISIMAGKQYAEAMYVVPPVAISILLLFYSQLFINVEFFYEEKRKLVGASIAAAVLNLVLNWFFIQRFGFVAAAYTTLASYMVFAFSNYKAMKKVLDEREIKDNAYSYKGLILVFCVFCGLSAIAELLYGNLIPRIVISVVVLISVYLKKEYFISIIKTTRKKVV